MPTISWFVIFMFWADIPPPILILNDPEIIVILDPGHGGEDRGGFGPNGFSSSRIRVPEDPYNYDVALRISKLTESRNWLTVFTVIDEGIEISDDDGILPPRNNIHFNFQFNRQVNTKDKNSLANRVYFSNLFAVLLRPTPIVFISLHFDYAPAYVCGPRIYTWRDLRTHQFVLRLDKALNASDLSFRINGRLSPRINYWNNLYVLHHGIVSPRVLIELGNYNCQKDRSKMESAVARQAYATAIVASIHDYLRSIKKAP
jgi:N-acetylmuramoyl-L-alanine amidase